MVACQQLNTSLTSACGIMFTFVVYEMANKQCFPCLLRCLMKAPLLVGCDVTNMSQDTLMILTNKEAIAVSKGCCQIIYLKFV